jgi:UDP-N-acetylmuramoylalanine--D-glutamate ligase
MCFGETKYRIQEFASSINIPCTVVENVKEAVREAYNISELGDTILLSPACASWDQYNCFEDRGNDFKSVVDKL